MSKGDAVMVAVRVRPLNRRELQMNTQICIDMKGNQVFISGGAKQNRTNSANYSFDHCFWSIDPDNPKFASQEDVFNALGGNFLKNSFEGYNGCVLAYGQTGSGKSYSMMGPPQGEEQRGLIPRLCDSLFSRIEQQANDRPDISSTVEVSYMEIYNERVRDLFMPRGQKELKVREHHSLGPYVDGLTKLATSTSGEIERLMLEGNRSRTVAATQMNSESSRSHAVFTIEFRQTEFDASRGIGTEKVSRISLVDLAGSERASKTGTTGDRLKEGSNINLALTTLGRVISALADISSGKKGNRDFVPYRDSVLTWLLKDSLGGNSRTIMIATISPAKDNFEETLSTLRYADSAKRIVNHAVINEDDNSRIIRELKEELNRLKEMMGAGGEPGARDVSSSENGLSEKLKDAQNMLEQREQSWSQKLDNTRKLEEERQQIMEEMGISIQSAGIQGRSGHFYLVNMSADPSMNELLVYNVKESTIVGRPENVPPPDIQLRGLSINKQHCKIEVSGTECVISRYDDSVIYVNGKEIFAPTRLYHGYRILLGNNHWFRVNAPGGHANPPEGDGDSDVDIASAKKELAMNDFDTIKSEMEEQKDEAIRKVQNEYESTIQEYRERLSDAMSVIPEAYNPPSELDSQSLIRLQEVVLYASDLVRTANQYSEALQKDVKFSVTLRISPSYLVPRFRLTAREDITSCVAIRVIFTSKSTDAVWSLDTLHEKLAVIAEMYEEFERNRGEKGEGVRMWWNESMGPDPFCDMENHSLIGVANAYLSCLFHFIPVEYSVPIVSPQGKQLGKVNLIIQRLNSLHHDFDNNDELDIPFSTGSSYTDSSISALHDILPDSKIYIRVTIQNAQELPPNLQFVFCQYRMFGLDDAVTVASVMEFGQQNSLSDGFISFNHTKTIPLDATEEFIDFCREGVLTIEVLGHRTTAVDGRDFIQSTSIDNSSEKKWARIRSFVSLSAKILELNVEGDHVPVELKESAQSLCGGTYQLKQGQSRKIHISVQNVQSSGRTVLGFIQNVEIGSVVVRPKHDVPLDSFQEQDFNIMKEKWGHTLMLRKDYLDSEMKGLMDKRDKTSEDVEKETKLIDEWLQMQQERNVLAHSDFSQILGMSKNWYLPLGYESRPPIIFIDVENDLVHKTGSLQGEQDGLMMPLKFKLESASKLDAVATWDATDHENKHLMGITASKDRVFIILRVTIAMKHPPGCKIRLRKRLQLRIVKGGRTGFLGGFPFGKEAVRKSGVVYEIFCGLPQTEGVPTRIEPHPSILEPNQGESIVQAFRRGMEEISNQIELDRLRQQISLKEQLTKAGSGHLNLPHSVSPGLHSGISISPRSQDELESPELDNIPGIVVSPPIHRPDKQPALIPHSISNSDLYTPPQSNSPIDFPQPDITDLQNADMTPTDSDLTPISLVTAPITDTPEENTLIIAPIIDTPEENTLIIAPIINTPEENTLIIAPIINTPEENTLIIAPIINTPEENTLIIAPIIKKNETPQQKPQPIINRRNMVIEVENLPANLLTPEASPTDGSRTFTDSESTESSDILRSPIKSALNQKHSAPIRKTSGGRVPNSFPVKSFSGRSTTPDLGERSQIQARHRISISASPEIDFKVNDRVIVDLKAGHKVAKVRYIGPFQHAKDNTETWVGLELTEPIGKNNGTVGTKVYFKCKENHGSFVPLSKIVCVCDARQQTRSSAGPRITRSSTPCDTSSRGRIKH